MCKETKIAVFILLAFCLFSLFQGVLQAQETPDSWYLILESELRSIEQFKTKSETDRQNWLLQAQTLKTESATLNNQLSKARAMQLKLTELYEASERERLTAISLKNGEIAELKQVLAAKTLEAETLKGKSAFRMLLIVIFTVVIGGYIASRILKIFHVFPFNIVR
jgi:hypothetical protein